MATITKEKTTPGEKLINKATGGVDDLTSKQRRELIIKDLAIAKNSALSYESLIKEVLGYDISLPKNPDVTDLSEINMLLHYAQNAFTRISNIEIMAIGNSNIWSKLKRNAKEYLSEKEDKLLVSKKVKKLPNAKQQQAAVRTKLKKTTRMVTKIENHEQEAIAFQKMVHEKKNDIDKTITNLNRQIKVLAMEQNLSR